MDTMKDLIIYCMDAFEPAEELRRCFAAKFPDISIHKSAGITNFYCTLATQKFRVVVIIACEKIPSGAAYSVNKLMKVGYPLENLFVYHFAPSTIDARHKSLAAEFVEGNDDEFFAAVKSAAEKGTDRRWLTYEDRFMARLDR